MAQLGHASSPLSSQLAFRITILPQRKELPMIGSRALPEVGSGHELLGAPQTTPARSVRTPAPSARPWRSPLNSGPQLPRSPPLFWAPSCAPPL